MSNSPARAAAYDILLRVEQQDSYASELLHSTRCAELTSTDHGLATELVMGTLRWRSSIDAFIGRASLKRPEKLDPEVLTALRLGAYQLGWLDRIPQRVAVHESVELVKRARKRSAVPFANAVLRKMAASTVEDARQEHRSEMNSPEGSAELARHLAHPFWLTERWVQTYGLEGAREIC